MAKNCSENARFQAARAALRRAARERRDGLDEKTRRALSLRIASRFLDMPETARAAVFLLYAAFRSEAETAGLLAALLARGKTVCLPRALPETREMRAIRVCAAGGGDLGLAPGFQGIPEPTSGHIFPPEDLDVVVVPGLLFDLKGYRLGYGGGFYDRFLANRARRAFKVGLGFALQVSEEAIPTAPHDMRLDALATEDGVWRFRNSAPPPALGGTRIPEPTPSA